MKLNRGGEVMGGMEVALTLRLRKGGLCQRMLPLLREK